MRNNRLIRIAIVTMALMLGSLGASSAQSIKYTGPKDFRGIVKISIPYPSNYPPLNSGMPFDVMMGYIYDDSLVRFFNANPNLRTDSIGMTLGPDTVRKALKYAYEMTDYDPTAWLLYQEDVPHTSQYSNTPPSELFGVLMHRAAQVDSDKAVSAGLTNVDFILQVSVFDTSSTIDSTCPQGLDTVEGVKAYVDDVIKGQNLPTCNDTQYRANPKGKEALATSPCIAFEYMLYWLSGIQDQRGVWQIGPRPPWTTPGNDYIVFLRYIPLGGDRTGYYATLSPGGISSTMECMYPIRNGIVYDPNNDFGLGANLTVSDFKSRLRAKIQTIKSY